MAAAPLDRLTTRSLGRFLLEAPKDFAARFPKLVRRLAVWSAISVWYPHLNCKPAAGAEPADPEVTGGWPEAHS